MITRTNQSSFPLKCPKPLLFSKAINGFIGLAYRAWVHNRTLVCSRGNLTLLPKKHIPSQGSALGVSWDSSHLWSCVACCFSVGKVAPSLLSHLCTCAHLHTWANTARRAFHSGGKVCVNRPLPGPQGVLVLIN